MGAKANKRADKAQGKPVTAQSVASDLSRRFFLDVFACGAVEIRERGKASRGGLPVYSTDTREEAKSLQVLHCRLERTAPIYRLNEFSGDVDGLGKVTEMFRASHERMIARVEAQANAEIERIAAAGNNRP